MGIQLKSLVVLALTSFGFVSSAAFAEETAAPAATTAPVKAEKHDKAAHKKDTKKDTKKETKKKKPAPTATPAAETTEGTDGAAPTE